MYPFLGNPLFLRQLLETLKEQGCIYINLSKPRWEWDLDKIMNLKLSNSVVALLMKEMQQLPSELLTGLKLASCMGASVSYATLNILSKDLGLDLLNILEQVSHKGFMNHEVSRFTWAHDTIEKAGVSRILYLETLHRFATYLC